MSLSEASRQMCLAYKNFLNPPTKITWGYASQRQRDVGYGGYEGLAKYSRNDAVSKASRDAISKKMFDLAQQFAFPTNPEEAEDDE